MAPGSGTLASRIAKAAFGFIRPSLYFWSLIDCKGVHDFQIAFNLAGLSHEISVFPGLSRHGSDRWRHAFSSRRVDRQKTPEIPQALS